MLTFADVATVLPNSCGIKGIEMNFQTITLNSSKSMEKGLFIYSETDSDLLKAIGNGAIAAIWPESVDLPLYTPNHFPVFIVNDSIDSLTILVKEYTDKIILNNSGDKTNMILEKNELQQNDPKIHEIYSLLNFGKTKQNGREY